MGNNEYDRIVDHHLEPENTIVHLITRHNTKRNQARAIRSLHGNCEKRKHDIRFETCDEFIKYFLDLCQQQETAAIYFVIRSDWREYLLDNYLERINGTTIGWFVGFDSEDKENKKRKVLFYRYKHIWLELPFEFNFGITQKDQRSIKRFFYKKKAIAS